MNFYKRIKIILQFLPLAGLYIFVDTTTYSFFGEYAWNFLIFLMFLRPLRDIFPKCGFLVKATTFRKELGIISGVFGITHVVGYFLLHSLPVSFLFDSIMWDLRGYMGWGMFALILAIILTATSNLFSIKIFGKYWKTLQRLSYFMLFTVAIHIALVKPEDLVSIILIIGAYIIVFIMAYRNNKTKKNFILTYFLSLINKIKVLFKKI